MTTIENTLTTVEELCRNAVFSCRLDESVKLPTTFGVYILRCEATGKIYVGSTTAKQGFRGRLRKHYERLSRGLPSTNCLVLAAVNHGLLSFRAYVIEETSKEDALKREQFYLDTLQPYKGAVGYNMAVYAKAPMRGRTFSDVSRGRLREAWQSKTPEQREAFAEQHRKDMNVRWKRPGYREKIVAALEKPFALQYDGVEFSGHNLEEFCRIRQLNSSGLRHVMLGDRSHYRGWQKAGVKSCWKCAVSPAGVKHAFFEPYVFAKTHKLNPQLFTAVLAGKRKQHKGWTTS